MERRKFLKYTSATLATPFLFQGQWISVLASHSEFELLSLYNPNRKLILVQLNGGNDGLNMVIPISEYDNLVNARQNLLVKQSKILKLTDNTGLHPSMPELTNLYQQGKVQIVQGVGYPNPNLSHFRSKDIIMSGSDSKTVVNSGWAGRMLNNQYPNYPVGYPNAKAPHPIALTIGSASSATCQGDLANYSSVLTNLSSAYSSSAVSGTYPVTPFGNELKFVTNVMEQTESYLTVIKEAAAKAKNLSTLYPTAGQNSLADQLKLVANLIAGGLQTQIYIVSLGGWDTHSGQVANDADKLTGTQPTLMSKLSKAIAAFEDDLTLLNKADEVVGFTFTEFGRRIKSNDSIGTDHGTTWPAIIFGSRVNPGLVGDNPTIPAVVNTSDNLPLQNDFRSIYGSLYKQWFEVDDSQIVQLLGNTFPEIQIISKATAVMPTFAEENTNIKFWPNPVKDVAQLSFDSDGEITQIRIYLMTGQLVENIVRQRFLKGNQTIQLQLGHLNSGTYQLVVQQKSGRETVKFIVI